MSVRPHYNVLVNRFRQQLIHINLLASTRFSLVAFSYKCILRTSSLILSNVSEHWKKMVFTLKDLLLRMSWWMLRMKPLATIQEITSHLFAMLLVLNLGFVDTWSSSFHVILGNKLNVSIKERLSLLSFCLSFFPFFSLTCHTRISSTICYFILSFHTRGCIGGQIFLSIPQWGLIVLYRA